MGISTLVEFNSFKISFLIKTLTMMDDTEKIVLLTIILRKRRRKKKLFGQHVENRLTRISSSCKGSIVKKIHLAFQKVNITFFLFNCRVSLYPFQLFFGKRNIKQKCICLKYSQEDCFL